MSSDQLWQRRQATTGSHAHTHTHLCLQLHPEVVGSVWAACVVSQRFHGIESRCRATMSSLRSTAATMLVMASCAGAFHHNLPRVAAREASATLSAMRTEHIQVVLDVRARAPQ